jgi:hypothetical protein
MGGTKRMTEFAARRSRLFTVRSYDVMSQSVGWVPQ